jgi:hypothetical protein
MLEKWASHPARNARIECQPATFAQGAIQAMNVLEKQRALKVFFQANRPVFGKTKPRSKKQTHGGPCPPRVCKMTSCPFAAATFTDPSRKDRLQALSVYFLPPLVS